MSTTQSLAETVDSAYRQAFYANPEHDFDQRWLQIAITRLQAQSGSLFRGVGQEPAAHWPSGQAAAISAVQQVWQNGQGAVLEVGSGHYQLLCPATWKGQVHAVAAFDLGLVEPTALPARLDEAQWAAGWLVLSDLQRDNLQLQQGSQIQAGALEVMAEVLAESTVELAIRAMLARVSRMFDADRVSFGWVSGRNIQLRHVSDMANPKKRQESLERIKAAMAEAADQNSCITAPAHDSISRFIDRAHRTLLSDQSVGAALSVPIRVDEQILAVITLERDQARAFAPSEIELLEAAGVLLGPVINHRRQSEGSLLRLLATRVNRMLGGVFSRTGAIWSAGISGVAVLAFAMHWVHLPYQLVGEAQIQAREIQAISAPFDGYIAQSVIREGDRVHSGDLLVALNVEELELERLRRESEIARLSRARQEAEGSFDRAGIRRADAELAVAQTELDQIQTRLDRAQIRAPYPALVIQGDLTQRIGSAVVGGDPLFSIAPNDSYRVDIQLPENQILDLHPDQMGSLLLAAFPDQTWPVRVLRVAPNTQFQDGQSFFRVEANLLGEVGDLLPGMRGVVRLDVDERPAWQVLGRDLFNWVRQTRWRFWG
ncbi:MAG: HlyD family efflux transporter periplasmic adaptor subunit [Litorivicinus sp.]